MKPLPTTPGWLTGLAFAAVAAVNVAGLWGNRVALQGALHEARRSFELDVAARATTMESRLGQVRADLAFLGASPTIARLDEARQDAPVLRQAAESALLMFLRGHEEVIRIEVRGSDGRPLLHVGRRGGVPVLWVSSEPTGREGAAVDPRRPRLTTSVPHGEAARRTAAGVTLETEVEPASLLDGGEPALETAWSCQLRDARGVPLGRYPLGPRKAAAAGPADVQAEAPVRAESWSAPGPFVLACAQPERSVMGLAEPVWARYRTTYALNLGVMALALLLGGFTVQQARRRARLEARAAEEAHVRELERQLFHAERLATVGRLAAGIAHEINNPLEGMANYLTLARDALARADAASAARHVAAVKHGLDRAAGIVRQVLAHADPAKAPRAAVDLNEVLRETGQFVQSRKEFGRVAFVLDLLPEPLVVHGNAIMLGQVVMNLIVNACEVQPERGEVRLTSRRDGAHAVAEFADRGPGIAEADRQRVFEPFFSTRDSTGLGLSICHTIVRQHDGELDVVARPGGGCVFRMRLPVRET